MLLLVVSVVAPAVPVGEEEDRAATSRSVSSLSRCAASSFRIIERVAFEVLALAAWSRFMSSMKAVSLSEAERADDGRFIVDDDRVGSNALGGGGPDTST